METIKNHLSLVVTIITLVAAIFAFDSRYVHAEEGKKESMVTSQKIDETKQSIKFTQQLVQQTTNNLRRSMLEDKVFEIEVKEAQRKSNALDKALKERYLRQLKEIPNEIPKTP